MDFSYAMLRLSKKNLENLCFLKRVFIINADINSYPFKSKSVEVAFMTFVLHLLPNPVTAILEIKHILQPNGKLFIITYDIDDLANSIYHKYFPKFSLLDNKRFVSENKFFKLIKGCGFSKIIVSKFPMIIRYKSVDEVINMINKRPFSTFLSFKKQTLSDHINKFQINLHEHFGDGEVINESKVMLLIAVNI